MMVTVMVQSDRDEHDEHDVILAPG